VTSTTEVNALPETQSNAVHSGNRSILNEPDSAGEVPPNVLQRIRREELRSIASWIKPGMRVLELGGGSGYQAQLMSELGCDVFSIDLPDRPTAVKSFFPVTSYDGRRIPAPASSFDLVFSSNVLEHIRDLSPILDEIKRVLKPQGIAIHIMPSASWRLWTTLTSFVHIAKRAMQRQPGSSEHPGEATSAGNNAPSVGFLRKALQGVLPHGEYPNAFAELFYFRRARWTDVLTKAGFEVLNSAPGGLYYSGYVLSESRTMESRRKLSRLLGSSTNVFITRPTRNTNPK
jgi:ubiquinone/menaquinone biosynthesis C-methylase UbiE